MTGYKVNLCLNVNSDDFCDIPLPAKALWLYLYHEAFEPLDDNFGETVFYNVKAISRAINSFDCRNIDELVKINALIPVTDDGVTDTLQSNGGVTHG